MRRMVGRILLGILFVLPGLLTLLVVYQIYLILNGWIIRPITLLLPSLGSEDPRWVLVQQYVAPPVSLAAVLLFLYLMGYLGKTRVNHWVDWLFGRVPGVSILYRAIRDASSAMQGPEGLKTIDTVLLVPFPHAGARATGYLMAESVDAASGERLVCVYIPIAVFPPSGYTLVYPRADVIVTNWEAAAPWKMLISGGLSLPAVVPFSQASPVNSATSTTPVG